MKAAECPRLPRFASRGNYRRSRTGAWDRIVRVGLSYGEPQVVIGLSFAAIVLALVVTFALVARQANEDLPR